MKINSSTIFFGGIVSVVVLIFVYTFTQVDNGSQFIKEIEKYREDRDRVFMNKNSPLPRKERASFHGLHYFEPDLKYKVNGKVVPFADKDTVLMATKGEEPIAYLKYGMLEFVLDGGEQNLILYKHLDNEDGKKAYFLPFRDKSSGKETYGGGRYLDLDVDNNISEIDFNLSYNPYCVYNPNYICPIPPQENTLKVSILAGEKNYNH